MPKLWEVKRAAPNPTIQALRSIADGLESGTLTYVSGSSVIDSHLEPDGMTRLWTVTANLVMKSPHVG